MDIRLPGALALKQVRTLYQILYRRLMRGHDQDE
jgi:hypothetical protein